MTPTGSAGITHDGASPGGDGLAFAFGVPGGVPEGLGFALGVSVGVGRLGIGFGFGGVDEEGPVKSMFGMFLISIGLLSQKGYLVCCQRLSAISGHEWNVPSGYVPSIC